MSGHARRQARTGAHAVTFGLSERNSVRGGTVMYRKAVSFGAALLLAGAVVLATPGLSEAQRHGGGFRGGGVHAGGFRGGFNRGAAFRGGFHRGPVFNRGAVFHRGAFNR